MKRALSIAGSDCSGGAGIQADLKTFSAHGVFGMSVIVSVVAENTEKVIDVQDISEDMIKKQIEAVFEDIGVDAVKIGMLSNPQCMKTVDSLWVWEDISKDFLSKKGKDIPVTYIQELCSKSFQEAAEYTIRLFMLSETSQEVISEWNRLALIEYKHNIKLKKYCLPYLQYLKEEGKKLAIATSLPRILCDSCLISNGIYDMFDVIRSTDEIGRGKNFPDIFEKISDELKVPLSRTLLIFYRLDICSTICSIIYGLFCFA